MKILKIKADKMQELTKFGFKYDSFGFYEYKQELPCGTPKMSVDEESRIIWTTIGDSILTILYDLIKADMVEVVEE